MKIPLVSDTRRTISTDYGVLKEDEGIAYRWVCVYGEIPEASTTDISWCVCVLKKMLYYNLTACFSETGLKTLITLKAALLSCFRGLFIIDDKGILRQITINDLPVGRSVDETLRLVQAFQFTDKHGEGTLLQPLPLMSSVFLIS